MTSDLDTGGHTLSDVGVCALSSSSQASRHAIHCPPVMMDFPISAQQQPARNVQGLSVCTAAESLAQELRASSLCRLGHDAECASERCRVDPRSRSIGSCGYDARAVGEHIASVARKLDLPAPRVQTVLELLEQGATVPFIARYRKEATGSLDEVAIRAISKTHQELTDLEARRTAILASLEADGRLDPKLAVALRAATTRAGLEDIYLPYRKKRKTRADVARERGLAALADEILAQPLAGEPGSRAATFVGPDVPDAAAALAGASDIVAEHLAEDAEVRARLRWLYAKEGKLSATLSKGIDPEQSKYRDWDGFSGLARRVPSHRYLALERGEREKELRVRLSVDADKAMRMLEEQAPLRPRSPFAELLRSALRDGYQRLLAPSLERELRSELKTRADEGAAQVFAENLKNVLLAAPFGPHCVLGIDPGLRTGAKCAVVGEQGTLLEHATVFLARGDNDKARAGQTLGGLVDRFRPKAIAVGNGTGGRETEAFVRGLGRDRGWSMPVVMVSETGASVYSASDLARKELPDVDLTIRGAVSIARRLQDPLAELVKVDPQALGVGQYQHDLKPALLASALGAVVEDCVHRVGVDLETASAPLLARVSGIGPQLAETIVTHRRTRGGFMERKDLLEVKGLGKRAFELAAGFLRVRGPQPLDATAVHPERYNVVKRMARDLRVSLPELVGNPRLVETLKLDEYIEEGLGLPTLRDIRSELERPGRDPRDTFEAPSFRDDIHDLEDLEVGMTLDGIVTNVTRFGAFVDVGVHQDGLVHISELSKDWVSDPSEVARAGQALRVRVLSVDLKRRRISLSAKLEATEDAP